MILHLKKRKTEQVPTYIRYVHHVFSGYAILQPNIYETCPEKREKSTRHIFMHIRYVDHVLSGSPILFPSVLKVFTEKTTQK